MPAAIRCRTCPQRPRRGRPTAGPGHPRPHSRRLRPCQPPVRAWGDCLHAVAAVAVARAAALRPVRPVRPAHSCVLPCRVVRKARAVYRGRAVHKHKVRAFRPRARKHPRGRPPGQAQPPDSSRWGRRQTRRGRPGLSPRGQHQPHRCQAVRTSRVLPRFSRFRPPRSTRMPLARRLTMRTVRYRVGSINKRLRRRPSPPLRRRRRP